MRIDHLDVRDRARELDRAVDVELGRKRMMRSCGQGACAGETAG
jgi:hypothetical protein